MLRVLIADGHPVMRLGVSQVLTNNSDIQIEQVGTMVELRDALTKRSPDVLILELSMPCGNALDTIPELRRTYPRVPILVLSEQPEQQSGVDAILAGATGYLDKRSPPAHLLSAVSRVSQGDRYVSPALGAVLAEYVFHGRTQVLPHQSLSAREYLVLMKISEGLTTAAIAGLLNVSPKTVGTYRTRLLRKMGLSTTAELTRYVVEKKLRLNRQ